MPHRTDDMQKYAVRQMSSLLGRLAFEMQKITKTQDVERVHDLRVAIRRFTQSLRAFAGFTPRKASKKIRRSLNGVMDLASLVRNRDIAIELLSKHKLDPVPSLARERNQAGKELALRLRRWLRNDVTSRWRSSLEI